MVLLLYRHDIDARYTMIMCPGVSLLTPAGKAAVLAHIAIMCYLMS